jgi:hypothetical protein
MRTASTLLFGVVGLASVALAPAARAQEAAPVAEVSATPARPKRIQVSVAFIPMAMGKFDFKAGGMPTTVDTAFIPGYTLQASYEVMQGLSVGLAPQAFFGVKPKDDPDGSNVDPSGTEITSKEYDLMVRLAYAYPVVESIRLYAELLPGYSLIIPSFGHTSKGFVLAADPHQVRARRAGRRRPLLADNLSINYGHLRGHSSRPADPPMTGGSEVIPWASTTRPAPDRSSKTRRMSWLPTWRPAGTPPAS